MLKVNVSYFRKIALIVLAIALVGITANATLSANLTKGIYPVDADSIGIPLMYALAHCLMLLALMLTAIIATRLGKAGSRARHIALRGLIVILYALAFLIAGEAVFSWFIPHHYVISGAYGFVIILMAMRIIGDMRELALNSSLHTDASRQ